MPLSLSSLVGRDLGRVSRGSGLERGAGLSSRGSQASKPASRGDLWQELGDLRRKNRDARGQEERSRFGDIKGDFKEGDLADDVQKLRDRVYKKRMRGAEKLDSGSNVYRQRLRRAEKEAELAVEREKLKRLRRAKTEIRREFSRELSEKMKELKKAHGESRQAL